MSHLFKQAAMSAQITTTCFWTNKDLDSLAPVIAGPVLCHQGSCSRSDLGGYERVQGHLHRIPAWYEE